MHTYLHTLTHSLAHTLCFCCCSQVGLAIKDVLQHPSLGILGRPKCSKSHQQLGSTNVVHYQLGWQPYTTQPIRVVCVGFALPKLLHTTIPPPYNDCGCPWCTQCESCPLFKVCCSYYLVSWGSCNSGCGEWSNHVSKKKTWKIGCTCKTNSGHATS